MAIFCVWGGGGTLQRLMLTGVGMSRFHSVREDPGLMEGQEQNHTP